MAVYHEQLDRWRSGLLTDLLDASLQQSGRPLALFLAETELVALTRRAVSEHQLVSNLHQVRFDPEVPSLVATVDETRLHRVLANLLTAIKYSPQGGPVRVSLTPRMDPTASPLCSSCVTKVWGFRMMTCPTSSTDSIKALAWSAGSREPAWGSPVRVSWWSCTGAPVERAGLT